MQREIVRQWVENNIYPNVSSGFRWFVLGLVFAVMVLIASHYDYQLLTQ